MTRREGVQIRLSSEETLTILLDRVISTVVDVSSWDDELEIIIAVKKKLKFR